MRDRIERRKRIRKIGALVVLGIFVATMVVPANVAAQDGDWEVTASDNVCTGHGGIWPTGNVGIGTNTPGAKLDVWGSAIFNDGSGDYDFRIEGDNEENLFFVDAGNDRIGIGTANPEARLEVKPTITGTADYTGIKSGIIYDGASPMINWYGTYIATPSGTGSILSKYALVTEANAGNVGIGTTSPQQKLTLGSGSNFATEMPAPGKPSATVYLSGGMIEDGTYYYVITALDGFGQTVKGIESDAVKVLGGSGYASVELTWTAVTGAVSYKVYRTTTPGDYSSPAYIGASVTNEYTDVKKDPSNGEPPSSTTAYVNKITSSGNSWFLGGKIGIGTNNPGVTLHVMSGVEEHIRVQKKGQNPYMDITSGGAWCGLELHNTLVELFSIWEGDWDTGQNRFHIRNGGNIGIGTMTPDKKLEIQDDTDAQLRLSNADAFYTDLQTTSSGHLYINPSGGRVGIGEASPGSELDVAGTITGDGLVIDGTVSGTGFNGWDKDDSDDLTTSTGFDGDVSGIYNNLQLRPEVVGSAELASSGVTAGTYGSATQVAQITVDGDGIIISAVNVNIDISGSETDPQVDDSQTTNYVPKWDGSALVTGTIYDNGNVGIGTSTPAYEMVIHDSSSDDSWLQFTQSSTGTTAMDGFLVGVDSSERARLLNRENTDMQFSTNNNVQMVIEADGDVGIGTTTPTANLHVNGDAKIGFSLLVCGDTEIAGSLDVDYHTLYVDRVNNRVGIGTTNPGSKLDVAGTITGDGLVISGTVSGLGFSGWDKDESDDLTTSTSFGGDVSGMYDKLQLASSGVTAGTYGSATQVAQITVDGDGRITSASNVDIIESDPQVGSISTNYVPKWDGSALVTGTIYDNGNVGIGDAPTSKNKLRVVSDSTTTEAYRAAIIGKAIGPFINTGDEGIGVYGLVDPDPTDSGTYCGILGVVGTTSSGTHIGVYGSASDGNKNWAGYFENGNVYIENRLGIGTDEPLARLHVEQTTTGLDPFRVRIGVLTKFIVKDNGDVGIGMVSPSSKLDVDGDIEIRYDGALYFGDPDTHGCWRIIRSGPNLNFERLEDGEWKVKMEIKTN